MFAALRALLFLFGSLGMDKAGSSWDPDGLAVQTDDKAGNMWDPNG